MSEEDLEAEPNQFDWEAFALVLMGVSGAIAFASLMLCASAFMIHYTWGELIVP